MMNRIILIAAIALHILSAKVSVVTSTTDLADIASMIGGDRVKVVSIARGTQDPHFVEVLPSYMIKVKRADIYFKVGMELDRWAQQIIDGSRNRKLIIVDCSKDIPRLGIPEGKIDASMGDIHRYGNPHYWLDPENAKIIGGTIAEALSQADIGGKSIYSENLQQFSEEIDEKLQSWMENYSDLYGQKIIFYHNTWPYFTNRFGLDVVQFVEPKPGIIPTPGHIEKLISVITEQQIKVVAMEPYFSDKAPKFLAEKTGVKIIKMAQSVGAQLPAKSYVEMIDYNLEILRSVLFK